MKPIAHTYYADLSRQYATKIRQLVPRYDDLLSQIVARVAQFAPAAILELGIGTGELAGRLLRGLPGARVTAIDAAPDMVDMARAGLTEFGDRARVALGDVSDFEPGRTFDAVASNLVLHNVPPREKRRLLRRILSWLAPGGRFVWGDFMRHPDVAIEQDIIARRIEHARATGCSEELIVVSFEKESGSDYPWTALETLLALRRSGYRDADCTWSDGAFAVFAGRRPGRRA